jgi:YcxB-like protein
MRIQYRLRYLDYLQFVVVHQFLSFRLQAVCLLLTGYIFWNEHQDNPVATSLVIAFVWFALIWLAQIIFTAIYIFTRRSDGNLTDHVIELRDDAFRESTKFNESRFFWPGIQRVVRRPGFVAVYVAQHMAHVIPMRAFASKKQAAEFMAFVREKMVAV